VLCPLCKGAFPILPDVGRRYPHQLHGRDTAVEGMRTACGAVLIASQSTSTIDDIGFGKPNAGASTTAAGSPLVLSPGLCLECLKAAAQNAATMVARG
jgi:hypothetical protein